MAEKLMAKISSILVVEYILLLSCIAVFFIVNFHNLVASTWILFAIGFAAACLHLNYLYIDDILFARYTIPNLEAIKMSGLTATIMSGGFTLVYLLLDILVASHVKIVFHQISSTFSSFMTFVSAYMLMKLADHYAQVSTLLARINSGIDFEDSMSEGEDIPINKRYAEVNEPDMNDMQVVPPSRNNIIMDQEISECSCEENNFYYNDYYNNRNEMNLTTTERTMLPV